MSDTEIMFESLSENDLSKAEVWLFQIIRAQLLAVEFTWRNKASGLEVSRRYELKASSSEASE